jgi:hypothetical protein
MGILGERYFQLSDDRLFGMIKRVAGGYKVVSESGKNLSRVLKSLGAAKKRLAQVEYFKHKGK